MGYHDTMLNIFNVNQKCRGILMIKFAIALLLLLSAATTPATIITGNVSDSASGEPLASVTIRVVGTGMTALTSLTGEYRLSLEDGEYQLRFSHVGHHSENVVVTVDRDQIARDVKLRRAFIKVSSIRVFERALDPAQQIIAQAIRRKQEILTKLGKYDFDGYMRLMAHDTTKEDSASILVIVESQMNGYWEYPEKYKEVITARRQTANIGADAILAIVPAFNFNESRMDFGVQSVISPTAEDALDYYDFYTLDTILIDGQRVFHLEVEPKNTSDPLFVGTIDIADSSFEVTTVSLQFTEGVEIPFVSNLLFEQRHARFENKYWMPVEILISGHMEIPIPGIPDITFELRKAIANYSFEPEHDRDLFDYVYEVAPSVDDVDSATWAAGPVIPLTPLEKRGYEYHDSLAAVPKSVAQRIKSGVFWLLGGAFSRDRFRFNRTEGAYVGWSHTFSPKFGHHLTATAGYAIDAKRFEHQLRWRQRLWQRRRLDFTASHFHKILGRPSLASSADRNTTMLALFYKSDPVDYYREEGFDLGLAVSLIKHVRFGVSYHDAQQYSSAISTQYSVFRSDDQWRVNPEIDNGHVRSVSSWIEYDSRSIVKMKKFEGKIGGFQFTKIRIEAEQADPDWISNDFDYARYSMRIQRRQRTFGLGVTELLAYAGWSDRRLPIQRLFTIDFGTPTLLGKMMSFNTLDDNGFSGDCVASVFVRHDFGTELWRMTGIPIVRDIPFSVGIQGGAFVTDFYRSANQPIVDSTAAGEGHYFHTAQRAYREIGFSIGRIPPLNSKLLFNWQLSDYDTNSFSFGLSLPF